MKEYVTPEIEKVTLSDCDVITASPGTETTPIPENGGIWDLDL
jgi:hypothetical protein